MGPSSHVIEGAELAFEARWLWPLSQSADAPRCTVFNIPKLAWPGNTFGYPPIIIITHESAVHCKTLGGVEPRHARATWLMGASMVFAPLCLCLPGSAWEPRPSWLSHGIWLMFQGLVQVQLCGTLPLISAGWFAKPLCVPAIFPMLFLMFGLSLSRTRSNSLGKVSGTEWTLG